MYNYYYPPGYPLCGEAAPPRYPKLTPSYPVPPMPYVVSGPPATVGTNGNGQKSWVLPAVGLLAAGAVGVASYSLLTKSKKSKFTTTVSGNMSDLFEEGLEDLEDEEALPGFAEDIIFDED